MKAFLVMSCTISLGIMMLCVGYSREHFDKEIHWYDRVGLIACYYMLVSGAILSLL